MYHVRSGGSSLWLRMWMCGGRGQGWGRLMERKESENSGKREIQAEALAERSSTCGKWQWNGDMQEGRRDAEWDLGPGERV